MAFFSLKSRIGAVRSLLDALQGQPELQASTATTQCAGLISQIESADLTADQKCIIQLRLQDLKVSPCDLSKLLGAFDVKAGASADADGGKKRVSRKKESQMQDYSNWHNYLLGEEWNKIEELGNAEVKDVYPASKLIADLVCSRMWCCNPSEPTLKFLASNVIALTFNNATEAMVRPLHEKIALRDYMRGEIKSYWKGMAKPLEMCIHLPSTSQLLAVEAPLLNAHMMTCNMSFAKTRLPLALVRRVDASWKCRANASAIVPTAPTADSMNMQSMLKMQMQMMHMHFQHLQNQGGGCPGETLKLDFSMGAESDNREGAKRSLGALRDAASHAWKRSRTASPAILDRSSAEPAVAPNEEPVSPNAEASEVLPDPDQEGAALIDAIIARDEQAKQDRKEASAKKAAAKAEEKAAAKTAAAVAKSADKAEKAEAKAVSVVAKSSLLIQKVKVKAAPAKALKMVATAAPSLPTLGSKASTKGSKPSFSNEHSRHQFLCRTGKKGAGQSHAIKYQPKGTITMKEAEAQAQQWVSERIDAIALAGA